MPKAFWLVLLVVPLLGGPVRAGREEPEVEAILEALTAEKLADRLAGAARLARAQDPAWNGVVLLLSSTGSSANRRVRELVERLGDPSWRIREKAQAELVELGATAVTALQQARQSASSPEVRWRAARALELIERAGPQVARIWRRQVDRLRAVAWGLAVAPPRRAERRKRAVRLLVYAMEDRDPVLRKHALHALSRMGRESALEGLGKLARTGQPLEVMAALHGLARIGTSAAHERLAALAADHPSAVVRLAAGILRKQAGLPVAELAGCPHLATHLAAYRPLAPAPAGGKELPSWNIRSRDGKPFAGRIREINFAGLVVQPQDSPPLQVALGDLLTASPPREMIPEPPAAQDWVLFRSGTWLPGRVLSLSGEEALVELHLVGRRRLARSDLRAFGHGPGPPAESAMAGPRDRFRLPDGSNRECTGLRLAEGVIAGEGLEERKVPAGESYHCVLAGSFGGEGLHSDDPRQTALVHGFELFAGGSLKGFLLEGREGRVLLAEPVLGPVTVPLDRVRRIRFRTVLGLGFNFVLAADFYADAIFRIGADARVTWRLEKLKTPWDVELLPSGNLLVCQQDGRIRELTPAGKELWSRGGFNTPYDADKLPNGNYLVADTGNRRIVEIDRQGKVVWEYDRVDPFDVERLPSGNTLVADWKGKRVIEIDPAGAIVWSVNDIKDPYDADRLANGNTLITIWGDKSRVIEVDPSGKVVWQVEGLDTPMDADRVGGGRTLVACASGVLLLDYSGKVIWEVKAEWAVEANWY